MPTPESTRCVLLRGSNNTNDRSVTPAPERGQADDHQRWNLTEVNDPLVAMAELALHERAQAARSAWGLQRVQSIALALPESDPPQDVNKLIAAVRRRLPNVSLWRWNDQTMVPLDAPLRQPAAPVANPAPAPPTEPTAAPPDPPASPSVSREELDMLLEALPGEHS